MVECIFRQSFLPEKIILWLSKEQFKSENEIPDSLLDRVNDRFEIKLVDGDIRSHKKYYYVLKEYPDSFIFLIDDDIYYPSNLIENTWKAHEKAPDAVICNFGSEIKYDKDSNPLLYNQWESTYKLLKKHVFFGSGGGTLINRSLLYRDITNIDLALQLTPIADDIWLNAMANLAGTCKILLPNRQILPICIDNDVKLASQNCSNGHNDIQLKALIDYYTKHIGVNPFEK